VNLLETLISSSKNNNDHSYNSPKNFFGIEEILNIIKTISGDNKSEILFMKIHILKFFNTFYSYVERETNNNKIRILVKFNKILYHEIGNLLNQQSFIEETNSNYQTIYYLYD